MRKARLHVDRSGTLTPTLPTQEKEKPGSIVRPHIDHAAEASRLDCTVRCGSWIRPRASTIRVPGLDAIPVTSSGSPGGSAEQNLEGRAQPQ